MKKAFLILLKFTLVLLGCYGCLALAVALFEPGTDGTAKRTFATPEAIDGISGLYRSIEREESKEEMLIVSEGPGQTLGFHRMRKIPKKWIPLNFTQEGWGYSDDDFLHNGSVIAHNDEQDSLIGLEFYGYRYGAFATRSSTTCPSRFKSLRRIESGDLYIHIYLDT